jgi:beta-lactamase class D
MTKSLNQPNVGRLSISPVKPTLVLYFLVSLLGRAFAAETSIERDLSAKFGSYSGAFVLYDEARQRWLRYQPEECRTRTSPCSTFKVLNSLIALETGVASGADYSLPWDGTRRSIEAWNQDQTLRSAFSASCVWYYQALATRIGLERYQQIMPKVDYGNNDLTGGVPQFWLQSSLTISPDEQVAFLRRLHAGKLPFSSKSVDTVLDIMTLSLAGQTIFRGKTGSAFDARKNVPTLGWFIGSVSTSSGLNLFATRVTGGENPSGITARKITESILSTLNILPKPG